MNYNVAFLIVIATTGFAAFGSLVVCRLLKLDARRRHHEVGNPVFLQVGVMFAVLLAFVFSEVWGEYNTAAQAINGECAALHGAAMVANTLPDNQGRPVTEAILKYTRGVAATEWPMMEHRHRSPAATADFNEIITVASHINVARPVDVSNQAQLLGLITQAHEERETRMFEMGSGLPHVMWAVLITIALSLVGSVMFAGVESRAAHVLFASAFTGCTVLVLVLVRMLDYPFEGALALGNADFVRIAGELSAMLSGA